MQYENHQQIYLLIVNYKMSQNTWEVISSCIKKWNFTPVYDLSLVRKQDEKRTLMSHEVAGNDPRNEYVNRALNKYLNNSEIADLRKDMALGWLPMSSPHGIFCNVLDIDKESYYISRNPDGTINKDKDWNPIYIYHWSKERVDFDKIKNKKEKRFLFFTRNKKRMIVAPTWYNGIKQMMLDFVDYMISSWWTRPYRVVENNQLKIIYRGALSEDWVNIYKARVKKFFTNIESWRGKRSRWDDIYKLVDEWWCNFWQYSKVILWNYFSRLASDMHFANRVLWYKWENEWAVFNSYEEFRKFSETISIYPWKKSTGNINILDAAWEKAQSIYYWKEGVLLYDIVNWKLVEREHVWILTKEYLTNLSYDQQIKQLDSMWMFQMCNKNPRTLKNKILFWYKPRSWLLWFINFIWKPLFYATFMSIGAGINWLMALITLNSTMFATEKLTGKLRLDWDRKRFLRKYNLLDNFDSIQAFENWIGATVLDFWIKATTFAKDVVQQWAFNIWDMLMQNSYKIRLFQQYFENYFPWIKSLTELEAKLDEIAQNKNNFPIYWFEQWNKLDNFIANAKAWVDNQIKNANTTANIRQSNISVHYTKSPLNQPAQDVFYTLFHFFAWWWYAKLKWAWNIIKDWMLNPYRDKYRWATLMDNLLIWNRIDPDDFRKYYMQQQELNYFMSKIHTAYLISKYCYRMWSTNVEDNDESTMFDNFDELFAYFKLFNWELAAFESTPDGAIMKTFFENFFWQLEHWLWAWNATVSASLPAFQLFLKKMFRKTYALEIGAEFISKMNNDYDKEENNWLSLLGKSVQDNCTWFTYYLEDNILNWEFDYYIPKWPNSYLNDFLWIQNQEIEFVNDEKKLAKYAMMLSKKWAFTNWILYSFPYFRQWNMSQFADETWFEEAFDKFRATKAYQDFTNDKFPVDMNNDDWLYVYNTVVWRLAQKWNINRDDLHASYKYSFTNDKWELVEWMNRDRQIQEDIVHRLMKDWISEERSKELTNIMLNYDNQYVDEAVRTLAYIEAQTPWEWMQVLAYIMSQKAYRDTYYSDTKVERQRKKDRTDEQIKEEYKVNKINAAKEYAKFVPLIDRQYTYPEIILRYAKTHNTSIADYISVTDEQIEKCSGKNALVIPWVTKNGKPYYNDRYEQNFAAQLVVDIIGAHWDPNAHKVMNAFWLIFDVDKYTDSETWEIDPKYAAYALRQTEIIYNHIDNLAVDEATSRILKQWTFMFWDSLFEAINKDPKLSQQYDIVNMQKDWVHYWYKEFKELDDIATEYAEDQIANAEYKKNWSKKKWSKNYNGKYKYSDYDWILNWWYYKKFYGFDNWYKTMKNKAYSNNYLKYRVFNWIPTEYQQDYLRYNEFLKAKANLEKSALRWSWAANKKQQGKWQKKDDGVWVTTKRGKSIQFYKMEDIDKPVEYKTPRRKRWVNKWSWTKPMWSTMWKHLTPSQKKK